MITAEEYERAERALMLDEARIGWFVHALVYALVNTGLIVLNVLLVVHTSANFYWFPFPLIGWGVGLTMHYYFGYRHADRTIEARQRKVEAMAARAHPAL